MDPVCVGMLVVEAEAEDVVAVGTWPTESESGNTVDEELVWVAVAAELEAVARKSGQKLLPISSISIQSELGQSFNHVKLPAINYRPAP